MMAKLALPVLVLLISCYVGKATALASDAYATVVIFNPGTEIIYARVMDMSTSTGSVDNAVPANSNVKISFERHKHYALFFAAGCSEDEKGNLKNCLTGNCPESGCTLANPPVAVTVIFYNNGSFTTSTDLGYNFALRGDFQCKCTCPSISCIISLKKCPSSQKLNKSGLTVACMAGDSTPSCEDDASAPSASISCFNEAIMKFTVSSPPKE